MLLKIILDKRKFFYADAKLTGQLQLKKMRRLFGYARTRCPYYSNLFSSAGIRQIRSFDDFERIPFLDKETLNANIADIAVKGKGSYLVSTSGSSAQPVSIFKNAYSVATTLVAGHPFFVERYVGTRIKKTAMLLIWGENSIETVAASRIDRVFRSETINLNVTDDMERNVEILMKERPDLLISYPSVIRNMAIYMQERGLSFDFLKIMVVSGELITPSFKEKYESFFKCKILNSYISTEGGLMAIDKLDSSGMKLMDDNVYLEVVDDDVRPVVGTEGRIVITDLNNCSTPLFRYTGLDDRGIVCVDGKGSRFLKLITGRITEDIVDKRGRHISPFFLTEILEKFSEMRKFQVIQESPEKFTIKAVVSSNSNYFANENRYYRKIKRELERMLKHDVYLTTELVGKIEKDNREQVFKVVRREF